MRRKEEFIDNLARESVYAKTQCLKKQANFYEQLSQYNSVHPGSSNLASETVQADQTNFEPDISVLVNSKTLINYNFDTTPNARMTQVGQARQKQDRFTLGSGDKTERHRHLNVISADGPHHHNTSRHQHSHHSKQSFSQNPTNNPDTVTQGPSQSNSKVSTPFQPLRPLFLRRRLSPLQTARGVPNRKVLHLFNYKGFQEKNHIIPDSEKKAVVHTLC